ncbi:MAG: hypothetical protein J6X27_01620 [Bacteroidaceae bacterium]|nr:hypothetical protein [Bacteroidaceae bacterium]
MNILDLDLDFFQNDVYYDYDGNKQRLSDDDFWPWAERDVRSFLEKKCGLNKTNPIIGCCAKTHDQLFNVIVEKGFDNINLYHVDAHDDLHPSASGKKCFVCNIINLMSCPVEERITVIKDHMSEGNVVGMLLAYQKLNSVFFITDKSKRWHISTRTPMFHKDFNENGEMLQIPTVKDGIVIDDFIRYPDLVKKVNWIEPEIPYHVEDYSSWQTPTSFDFVFFCQSPRFTSEASDALIPIIKEYIKLE